MSRNTITVQRIVGTVVAATIVSIFGGLTATTPAHALAVAPMAKCISGSGKPSQSVPLAEPSARLTRNDRFPDLVERRSGLRLGEEEDATGDFGQP